MVKTLSFFTVLISARRVRNRILKNKRRTRALDWPIMIGGSEK